MSVHPDVESRRVRYLEEHDVLILKQHKEQTKVTGYLGRKKTTHFSLS
jgi:hypothetical protein